MSQPFVRWIVSGDTPRTLAAVAASLHPLGADAVGDGRVFVDGRRTTAGDFTPGAGSVVEMYAPRAGGGDVQILALHGGLVFVNKPPGVATEPDHGGIGGSVVARAEVLLDLPRGGLHAVSRLDVGVSGVVTLARDTGAVGLVEKLRGRGAFRRRYVGVLGKPPEPSRGSWSASIGRGTGRRRAADVAGGRDALTRYATVSVAPVLPAAAAKVRVQPAFVALEPVTGRTHQLRVHAAAAGAPLLGDAMYGGARRLTLPTGSVEALTRPLLHAAWVELGLTGAALRVTAPAPADLLGWWAQAGGAADAWDAGISAEC